MKNFSIATLLSIILALLLILTVIQFNLVSKTVSQATAAAKSNSSESNSETNLVPAVAVSGPFIVVVRGDRIYLYTIKSSTLRKGQKILSLESSVQIKNE